jgi:ribonuclease BN (tRNA processing enzyme)
MEVTILGSGTAVPVPDRFPAGVLVTHREHVARREEGPGRKDGAGREDGAGSETVLAVDLGPGVLRRMAQAGHGPQSLTAVLLTHYHTDHCADLAALLFALRNPIYRGRPPLRLFGGAGLADLVGHLTTAWPWLRPSGYDLQVTEIGPGSFALGGLEVTAVDIEHTAASLAYRIATPSGAAVAVSGDADDCEGLAIVAAGTDLFVCEAATPDGARIDGHITPSIAGRAAQRAGTRTLCLTHFYPQCEGHDLAGQAATTFSGEIVLARDLLRFELGDILDAKAPARNPSPPPDPHPSP